MKALVLVLAALVVMAAGAPEQPLADKAQEARAVRLFTEFRCPTCIAQSIHDSSADIARDLRILVREQIAAGKSDQQIRDYLVARYGDVILLRPPVKKNTIVLWLGPWLIFLIGGVMVFLVVRRHGETAP